MEKAIAKQHTTVVPVDAEALILKAVENNVNVETMERLLAMRKELRAEQAREEYYRSMAALQGAMPPIKKTRKVMNKDGKTVRYKYANQDDILEQVGPLIRDHGFSYKSDSVFQDGFVIATITITHSGGHSDTSSFPVPIDKEAYMNNQQQQKSADTFAKRVAFCNAFGIVTADEDDDAQSAGYVPTAKDIYKRMMEHQQAVRENWASIGALREHLAVNDYDLAAEAYHEINDEDKQRLWLAPTKGGIFTTKEREQLHSNEFMEARKKFFEPGEQQ